MMEISNCPNNDRRLKNSSLFRDVLENFDLYYCTIGRKPIVLIHGIIQGAMNKGNIFSSESEHDTPQPDGSVVKTSVFKHLGFI
jgi:hypothetical protein